MKIGVDVDGTVVDPMPLWWMWLCGMTNTEKPFPHGGMLSNDLADYFTKEMKNVPSFDPLDFWRGENIYDFLHPLPGAKKAIWEMKQKMGCEIHWVTHCKGRHMKSKASFLKRHFPFDGLHITQEKDMIGVDVLIDDRDYNFDKLSPEKVGIRVESRYQQRLRPLGLTPLKDNIHINKPWRVIPLIIKAEAKTRGL